MITLFFTLFLQVFYSSRNYFFPLKKLTVLLSSCFLILAHWAIAQDSTAKHSFRSDFSAYYYNTSSQMPFWLRANQYDIIPQKTAIALSGAADFESNLLANNNKWKLVGGAQIVGNLMDNRKTIVFLPQLYGGVRYKNLLLYAGRRKEIIGLADTTLGTGSYIWSGNAFPMPKIQIELSEYQPIGKKNPWFAFKGNYSHGWFGTSKFAYGYYLHQKSLYIRLGRQSSPVKLYGGFNHQVQWGGKTFDDIGTVSNKTLPSGFIDYLLAVIAVGPNIGIRKGNAFDSTNRVGNHLGTVDMGLEIELKKYNILLYRQSIYEDGSLFYLTSISDGLNGISFTNLYPSKEKRRISFKKIVFEILNTRSQGGGDFVIDDNQRRGKDEYFNHQQYYDGWAYRRRIIGTPFITNQEDTNRPEEQNTNDMANNNRVLVYHLGFEGNIGPSIQFLSKISYSANYGTYIYPYPTVPKQLSALLQLKGQIPAFSGLEWVASAAIDRGDLYTKNTGFKIGFRQTFGTGKFRTSH